MKGTTLLIIGLLLSLASYGQFAIIEDADGYTNIRDKNKKIVGKVYENTILALEEDSDVDSYDAIMDIWTIPSHFVRYDGLDDDKSEVAKYDGSIFIHRSRVKRLNELPQLNKKIQNENKAIFYNDQYTVEIISQRLNLSHKKDVKYHSFEEVKIPLEIDGYVVHGIDWDVSERDTEIKSINYSSNGKTHQFDAQQLSGLLNITPEYLDIAVHKDTLYIYGFGGDGSGGYAVLWVIKDGGVKQLIAYNPY